MSEDKLINFILEKAHHCYCCKEGHSKLFPSYGRETIPASSSPCGHTMKYVEPVIKRKDGTVIGITDAVEILKKSQQEGREFTEVLDELMK